MVRISKLQAIKVTMVLVVCMMMMFYLEFNVQLIQELGVKVEDRVQESMSVEKDFRSRRSNHRTIPGESAKFISEFTISKCSSSRRPESIQVLKSTWQVHSDQDGDVYIYSAHFDDRPVAGFLPTVRVIILATYYPNMTGFCYVWYDGLESPYVVAAEINETGMNRYQFGKHGYREYTYTCPLPVSYPIPTHVSITAKECDGLTTYTKVVYTPRREPIFEFGVCVTNGYGHMPWEEFVEWAELNLMFGASEINLYDSHYENMSTVFNFYKTKGILRVLNVPHPLNMSERFHHKMRNLRTVALNDCMLRNMYRYRYLVVIDHDEVIVPKYHDNYSEVTRKTNEKLKLSEPHHSYSFFNTFFLLDFPPDTDKPSYLKTVRYRNRAKPNYEYYASKSFINPLYCFNLFNHYCYNLFPGVKKPVSVFVPLTIAASHHYRKCGTFDGLTCPELYLQKTLDYVMLRHERNITRRVQPILTSIGLL